MRFALWGGDTALLRQEALDVLSSESEQCFIAKTDSGEAIGFLEVSCRRTKDHTYGYLEGWYVAPEHRRQGVGTDLIDHAEQWLLHNSIEAFFSDTDQANYPESLPAHARSGYEPIRHFTLLKKHVSNQRLHSDVASRRR
jgi:aminoglycoside 6'-N-acetyltransferase I